MTIGKIIPPPSSSVSFIRLGALLDDGCFQNGIYKHSDEYGTGTPILRITDFDNHGRLTSSSFKRVALSPQEQSQYAIRENDILINRVNSLSHIGKSMLVPSMHEYPVFESNMMRIRIKDECLLAPEYVATVLQAEPARKHFRKVAKPAVAQASINQDDVRTVAIALYPKATQRWIAKALFTWDLALEKIEQLIATKERYYEALSGQLLFGLTRLRQYGTSKPKSLHWFSMSCEWPVVEIGQIAREVSVSRGETADLPVLSCTKYDGLVDSLQYFKKQVFSHDTSKYKLVEQGQFAYATNHIEEGSIGYQDLVPAGLVSPIYTVFQSNTSRVDDGYLYKLLKTEKLRQLFAASTNASVDRRGSLRWKEFSRIHIPLPPLDEQRSINEVLNTAKMEIALLQAEAEALKSQKRGLMQKLLTGQWRLPIPKEKEVPVNG